MKPGSKEYPLATVITYGPDNQIATKLVVSIFKKPNRTDSDALKKWIVSSGDIRLDPAIAQEVADFIKSHHVARTSSYDRILGCPHEEGVDYPLGGVCPHCPFWEKVDRFSYEPKSPGLELSAQQILAGISVEQQAPPLKSLAAAELNKGLVVEPLLQAVEWVISDPKNVPSALGILFGYATYLLAKWRETRAFPLFLRWFSLPGEGPYDVGGDIPTQHGSRFLASVCGGDIEPIKRLILDRAADEFCRAQAIESLAVLAAWGELPREQVVDYFQKEKRGQPIVWFIFHTISGMGWIGLVDFLIHWYSRALALFEVPRCRHTAIARSLSVVSPAHDRVHGTEDIQRVVCAA